MDLIHMLKSAINFMESNLLEPITYEDVAKHVFISSYHFHRTFSLITGFTASEYIKNRRLSLAGQEILLSDEKIITIAMKYGYETPESFTKAFTRFHGISPTSVRKSGHELKMFNRLQIKITLEGGMSMNYRIEKRKPFTLIAKVREFDNEIVNQENNMDIPNFWDESIANNIFEVLSTCSTSQDTYGVCSPISKESKKFNYGIAKEYTGGNIPDGFILWEVKPPLWAVFKCIGDTGECIGEVWKKIFSEFLPNSEYTMLDDVDFELYSNIPGCFCEIWIPVEVKEQI